MCPTFFNKTFPTQRGPSEVTIFGKCSACSVYNFLWVRIDNVKTPAAIKGKPAVD